MPSRSKKSRVRKKFQRTNRPKGAGQQRRDRADPQRREALKKQENAVTAEWRRQIVGEGADPKLATCPIDIMFARRLIEAEHRGAAKWFAKLYRYRNGSPRTTGTLDGNRMGKSVTYENERWDLEWFALAERRGITECLVNLIVFEQLPKWLKDFVDSGVRPGRNDEIDGLERLRIAWLEVGKASDESLYAMSRQGRAMIDNANLAITYG